MKISPYNKQTNITQSKLFLDYLQITIWFPQDTISSLSDSDKQTLFNLQNRFIAPLPPQHFTDVKHSEIITTKDYNSPSEECPTCHWSLHEPCNSTMMIKNSINIFKSKNYSVLMHFTGGFFRDNNWQDNFKQIDKVLTNVDNFLYNRLVKVFGDNYPTYHLVVSRIDFAYNFYNAHITNPEKQTFANPKIRDFGVAQDGLFGTITGITLSKYDTDKVFFRSYDKRYDANKGAKEKAIARFNTNQFVRNEWRIRGNKLRKLGLKKWSDWQTVFKNKSLVNQLILHLRKSRDVTFFTSKRHPYNLIHLKKGYQTFKHKPVIKPDVYTWTPDKTILGNMKNHDVELNTYVEILRHIKDNTDLIKNDHWQSLKQNWFNEGLINIIPKNA